MPLLELLAGLPGGHADRQTVLAEFEARFGTLIPPAHREEGRGGSPTLWIYWLRWQRRELAQAGMVDTSQRGVWGITASGLRWLQENPTSTQLQPTRSRSSQVSRRRRGASPKRKAVSFTIRGHTSSLSVEQVLAVAREALSSGLPPEAANYRSWAVLIDGHRIGLKWLFRQATGIESFNTSHARDILQRRLGLECIRDGQTRRSGRRPRARRASVGEEAAWLEAARREARSVRQLLAGRSARPSDERLCDMVQFCYTFGLYAEAMQLFQLIDRASVNSWFYDRTRRLAMVCRTRADA